MASSSVVVARSCHASWPRGGFAKIAERYPDDPQQTELHGRALVLAGRNDEAVKAGERSLAMRRTSLDAVNGPYYKYQVARIYIQAGQYDRALDLIEPLLSKPGVMSIPSSRRCAALSASSVSSTPARNPQRQPRRARSHYA